MENSKHASPLRLWIRTHNFLYTNHSFSAPESWLMVKMAFFFTVDLGFAFYVSTKVFLLGLVHSDFTLPN